MASKLALVDRNGSELVYPRAPRYRPQRGHVVIRKRERGLSESGLQLPDNMSKSLREAEVVLVGEPRYFDNGQQIPMDVSVGDIILYSEPAGLTLDVHDPDLQLLFEGNVLATLIPETE